MPLLPPPARALAPLAALAATLAVPPPSVLAQSPGALAVGPVEPEIRLDALLAERRQTYHLGVGAFRSVGRAVRAGVVVGGGITDREAGYQGARLSSRAEVVGRFTLRTSDAGRPQLYLGAGAGALWVTNESGRGVAHLLVGGEVYGGGWRHAFELGLGGGVRLGVVLRRAR
jgi:hypothetical protein